MTEREMTAFAERAMRSAMSMADTSAERSEFVATSVGAKAARSQWDKQQLRKWFQTGYGTVFVRLQNLDPGADLKDIVKIAEKSFDIASRRLKKGETHDNLRAKVIRLAHTKPEIRPHLLPLLKEATIEHAPTAYLDSRESRVVMLFDSGHDRSDEKAALSEAKRIADMLGKDKRVTVTLIGKVSGAFPVLFPGSIPMGLDFSGDSRRVEHHLQTLQRRGVIEKVIVR